VRVLEVLVADGLRVTQCGNAPVIQKQNPLAQALDLLDVVRDEKDGALLLVDEVHHAVVALALERDVAHRQHLVDDEDFRVDGRGNRESEPHLHAGAVALQRRVDELLQLGKGHDLVELVRDVGPAHPEDGAVQEDVLATGEFADQPGAHLDERGDTATYLDLSACRLRNAGQHLQQRALSGAVVADDAQHLAGCDREADVGQGAEAASVDGRGIAQPRKAAGERLAQAAVAADAEFLA